DGQTARRSLVARHERLTSLEHAVVSKHISGAGRVIRSGEQQALGQGGFEVEDRYSSRAPRNCREIRKPEARPQTSSTAQRVRQRCRQLRNPLCEQLNHTLRGRQASKRLGVPRPAAARWLEAKHSALQQRLQQLVNEKGVAASPCQDVLGEGFGAFQRSTKAVIQKILDFLLTPAFEMQAFDLDGRSLQAR